MQNANSSSNMVVAWPDPNSGHGCHMLKKSIACMLYVRGVGIALALAPRIRVVGLELLEVSAHNATGGCNSKKHPQLPK